MKRFIFFTVLSLALVFSSCTSTKPTVSETTTTAPETKQPPKPQKKYLSKPGCVKWDDLPYAEKEQAADNYSIYRSRLSAKDVKGAYEFWQKVYETAPAADGMRKTVFLDGVEFNIGFYNQTQDTTEQRTYVNNIKRLYQEAMDCYGDEAYFNGLLGFDLYYNFSNHATDLEKYSYLKKAIDLSKGKKVPAFVINPFTALMIQLYMDKKIPQEEAQKYAMMIPGIIEYGLTKGDEKESYAIVNSYTPARLEELEGIKGFYDCDYYKAKFIPIFERNLTNCDTIMMTYSRLNWGGCPKTDADFIKVSQVYASNCTVVDDTPKSKKGQAYLALKEGRYQDAVQLFDEVIDEETDPKEKAKYAIVNAKIYFSYLKKFYKSRNYARQALKYDAHSGPAYMIMGRLYASSGPICGPGTGWDSQIVTWPAIDMWKKAKSVDPSVAGEAGKLIRRYQKYMPSREDIFQHGLKEGASFHVPCWINANTTIRAAH